MEEKSHRLVKYLKSLGNPLRYSICRLLHQEGPLSVGEIVETLEKEQNTISQHLSKLRDLDIVYYEREGRKLLYDVDKVDFVETIIGLEELLSRN